MMDIKFFTNVGERDGGVDFFTYFIIIIKKGQQCKAER